MKIESLVYSGLVHAPYSSIVLFKILSGMCLALVLERFISTYVEVPLYVKVDPWYPFIL